MNRDTPLVEGEAYHVYNRGAHKHDIFHIDEDYQRFLMLLYLGNSTDPVNLRNILEKHKGLTFAHLVELETVGQSLVEVLAYCLLPNHFHMVVRQKTEQGISLFLQKVCTAYSMYFNLKHRYSGTLFQGRFKSSHLDTDPYFKWIFPYVHLNPVSLTEPEWQEKGIGDPARAKEFLRNYRYSSYHDYYVGERPERAILALDETVDLLDKEADIHGMLAAYAKGRVLYSSA